MAASRDFDNSVLTDAEDPVQSRRSRYARVSGGAPPTLTPQKVAILKFLSECRLLSLPQLACLCCPSEQSARRHLRELFDAGLVGVIAVSRAALSPSEAANDARLLYGSAPNIYVPTKLGLEALVRAGHLDRDVLPRSTPALGPKNALFLAHELAVRDVRVWLEVDALAYSTRRVLEWRVGSEAHLSHSSGATRPDTWFAYQLGWHQAAIETPKQVPLVLVGLCEIDRGTERGSTRWAEKIADYGALFHDGEALRNATGYHNARVLVFVPTARRRDSLAALIASQVRTQRFPSRLLDRFWLVEHSFLMDGDLGAAVWRRPEDETLQPLLSPALLGSLPAVAFNQSTTGSATTKSQHDKEDVT